MNEVRLERLNEGYLDQMLKIQDVCWEKDSGIFVKSSRAAYARAFAFRNFVVGALDGDRLAGFLNCASHNRTSRMNLGRYLGYAPEALDRVGHLNTVLMLPSYRGLGLAQRLVQLAIDEFPPESRYLMATTAPENLAAQRILAGFGFSRQGGEILIGGQKRLLFVRDREGRRGDGFAAP